MDNVIDIIDSTCVGDRLSDVSKDALGEESEFVRKICDTLIETLDEVARSYEVTDCVNDLLVMKARLDIHEVIIRLEARWAVADEKRKIARRMELMEKLKILEAEKEFLENLKFERTKNYE